VNIMLMVLHSRWTVLLWVEWSVLKLTLFVNYFSTGGDWNCNMNVDSCSEKYTNVTAQEAPVLLQREWIVLQRI